MTTNAHSRLRPDLVERYTTRLTTSPVGCAFLATAQAAGMSPDDIVEPTTALHLLGAAAEQINPHAQDLLERTVEALSRGPRLTRLARQLMRLPEAQAWWAPLDRERQVWTSLSSSVRSPDSGFYFDAPMPEPSPGRFFVFTSTQVADVASLDFAWDWDMAMDPMGGESPIPRQRMAVSPRARVYEIREFDDWRELVRAYPYDRRITEQEHIFRRENPAYDWAIREVKLDRYKAAQDWDGIHLTFGGVLLTSGIIGPVGTGWTRIVTGSEYTHWLNRVLNSESPLPDVDSLPGLKRFYRKTLPKPVEDAVLFPDPNDTR